MLAQADVPQIVAGAVIGAIFSGLSVLLGIWLTHRRKERRQDAQDEAASDARDAKVRKDAYKDARDAWKEHLASKDEYIRMQAGVISEMERAGEAAQHALAECREDAAEQGVVNRLLYDLLRRAYAALKALGQDPGPMPDLPQPRQRRAASEAEFLARQAAQSAAVVRELGDSHVPEPKPPKGG